MANKLFFIVIFHFSLVKATMNAPHLCKLRKDYFADIGHGAMVLTKRLHFFIFSNCQRRNKDHYALANFGGVEFLKLTVDRHIYNCKLRNEKKDLIQEGSEF